MADAAPFREVKYRGLITAATMIAVIMQILDMTIANVALPSMQSSLGAAQDTIAWVLTSYIVASAIATPVTGWLSDRFGRKRLFLVSVGGFVIASALCGSAMSLEQMVFYRILQGAFGAALSPLSQAVLLDINPRERHGQAMAMWGAGIMVAPVIGPTLGGWLTEVFNWRWVFYINLPVGIIAFLGIWIYLPETVKRIRRFDFFGFAALSIGIGALQLLLDRGQQLDWFSSTEIWIEAAIFVCGLWIFAVHSLSAREPFIEMDLLRDRNFVTGLVLMFMTAVVLFATMTLLPILLQHIYGYPTILSGEVLVPRGVATMLMMIAVGRLLRYVDARILVCIGTLLCASSTWYMTGFSPEMDYWPFITSGILQGLGMGLVFVPLNTLAFATLSPKFRTEATSLFNLMRNIGSAIGISIMITLLARFAQINHAEIGSHITPFWTAPPNALISNGAQIAGNPQLAALLDLQINLQSQVIGYLNDFKLMTFLTLATIPLLFLIRKPKKAAPAPVMSE